MSSAAKIVVRVTQQFSDVTHTPGIPAISRSRSVFVIAAESFGDCMTLHDVRTAVDFSLAEGGSIVYLQKTKNVVGYCFSNFDQHAGIIVAVYVGANWRAGWE